MPECTCLMCRSPFPTGGSARSTPRLRLRYFRVGGFLATSRPLPRPVVNRLHLDAALFGHPPLRGQVLQRIDGRAHHVVRVGRAQALGENIAHARALEYGAHRAARDHAGPRRGGLQEHPARAMVPHDLVRDGAARERHFHHAPARGFHGFAHRLTHFVGFAGRDADPPLPIADRDQRVEPEPPATLDDLGDAVDRDHVLDQAVAFALALTAVAALTAAPPAPPPAPASARRRRPHRHRHPRLPPRPRRVAVPGPPPPRRPRARFRLLRPCPACPRAQPPAARRAPDLSPSELQSALAGAIGHRFDAPVVLVAPAIEHDLGDALLLRLAGDEMPQRKAARRLALPLDRDPLRPVRRSHERDASRVVYELGVDVFRGAEHDEPRPPRRARHLVAYPQMPLVTAVLARPDLVDRSHGLFGRLGGLAGLAPDLLAYVADPLALVRFGGPDGAELSRHLPHELLVDARDLL